MTAGFSTEACLEQVDAEALALSQHRELLKAQESAVSAKRHDLKEKQREASEAVEYGF